MRKPLIFSVASHVAIMLFTFVAFPSPEELPAMETRALPVELVTIDEVTNLKRQQKVEKPKPVEEPAPPRPQEPAPPRPEPKPTPAPTPPPPPEEKVEPLPEKKVEKKEEKPKPAEKKEDKKPTPPRKEPEKKTFDPNQIAALLDKTPDRAPPPQPQQSADTEFDAPRTDDASAPLTMSEIDAFRAQMRRCWTVPAGSPNAEQLVVRIKVYLNADGSLSGAPELQDRAQMLTGGPYYRAAAESALRAIRLCAPYKMPADKYSRWRELDLKFDPREMLGG